MAIVPFLADGAFDAEATRLLASAFEAAWQAVKTSDIVLADETHVASTRERLAKRVIEMGRRGERNHDRLVEDALVHLASSREASDIAIATSSELPISLSQRRSPVLASTRRAMPCH